MLTDSIALGANRETVLAAVALIAALGTLVAIFRRPAVGAAIILALIPLQGAVMAGGHSAAKLVTAMCLLVLVVRMFAARTPIHVDRTTFWMIALLEWACVTLLWGATHGGGLSHWISFSLQASLYVVLLNLILSADDLKLALWGYVLGSALLSLALVGAMVSSDFNRRLVVAGLGLNLAARFAALGVIVSAMLYQFEKWAAARLLLLASVGISIAAVVLSMSRGAWLAAALGLVVAAAVLAGRRRVNPAQLLIWSAVGVGAYCMLNAFALSGHGVQKLTDRFMAAVTLSDGGSNRLQIWQVGLDMVGDAPLSGHGWDSFEGRFPAYVARTGMTDVFDFGKEKGAHSAYVQVSAELGLIGFALFAAVLLSVWRRIHSPGAKRHAAIQARAWAMALFAFLVVSCGVDSALDRKYLWCILAVITLVMQYWTKSPSMDEPVSSDPGLDHLLAKGNLR